MNFKYTLIVLIFLIFLPSLAIGEVPIRNGNSIEFSNGTKLLISPKVVIEGDRWGQAGNLSILD